MQNENQSGITALEWEPCSDHIVTGGTLMFADKDGYVGMFGVALPEAETTNKNRDLLAEDSLLMEVRMYLTIP